MQVIIAVARSELRNSELTMALYANEPIRKDAGMCLRHQRNAKILDVLIIFAFKG